MRDNGRVLEHDFAFATAMTLRDERFTVTARLGPLVGRASEIEAAQRLLLDQDVRLLTVTGPGGVGKTRLALELAEGLDAAFPHGVHVVDLSPVRDAGFLLIAIAEAIGLRHGSARHALDRLKRHVGRQRVLLVLHNLEQVQDVAAQIGRLLSSCHGLVILGTSREPIRLRVERRLPLAPLRLANPRRPAADQVARPAPSVALFAQRARAVRPDFDLTEDNAPAVARFAPDWTDCRSPSSWRAAGDLDDTRRCHALYFLQLAQKASTGPLRAEALAEFARLDEDHANMLAALDWASATGANDLELERE